MISHEDSYESYSTDQVILGILMNVVGSFFSAAAFVLQKLTHTEEGNTPMYQRWRWWVGLILLIGSGVLQGVSLAMVPLAIVAPLSGLTVFLNTAFSVSILQEKTNATEVAITVVIVVGLAMSTYFGPHGGKTDWTAGELKNSLERWSTAVYFMAVGVLLGLYALLIKGFGVCHSVKRLHAFAFANVAACCGGQQNAMLKSLFMLAKTTVEGKNQFAEPWFYFIFLIGTAFGVSQLVALNLGLAQHDAVSYIPVYQATLVLYAVISGAALFDELKHLGQQDVAGFIIGVITIIVSIFVLTSLKGDDKVLIKADDEETSLIQGQEYKDTESQLQDAELDTTAGAGDADFNTV